MPMLANVLLRTQGKTRLRLLRIRKKFKEVRERIRSKSSVVSNPSWSTWSADTG